MARQKQKQLRASDWKDISTDEAYRLSVAEFRGMVIQSLQDIREDIKNMQQDSKITRWITFGIGGAGGMLISVLTALGFKQHTG
jgi:hypothetical protein